MSNIVLLPIGSASGPSRLLCCNIRPLMGRAGFSSQADLARAADVSEATLSAIVKRGAKDKERAVPDGEKKRTASKLIAVFRKRGLSEEEIFAAPVNENLPLEMLRTLKELLKEVREITANLPRQD